MAREQVSPSYVLDNVDNQTRFKPITVKRYFMEYLFPDALIYGMTSKEFWEDDPQLLFSYRFSYIKKKQIEFQEENRRAWLNGLYVYDAVTVVVANALAGKKKKPLEYAKEPIDFNKKPETKVEKETKEVKKRNNWGRFKERWKQNGISKNS